MPGGHYARPSIEIRFWAKVAKSDGCWLWTAHVNNKGYGEIRYNDGVEYAHRVSWILHFGVIPVGLCVLHHCDTPRCVRPDHLFLGTQLENLEDMGRKGRRRGTTRRGEMHNLAKLTEAKVIEIRASQLSCKELSILYGVAAPHIWGIRNRKTWRHV